MVAALAAVAVTAGCHDTAGPDASSMPHGAATAHRDPTTPEPARSHRLITTAVWLHAPEGYRLAVQPTHYGRLHAAGQVSGALTQALRRASPAPLRVSKAIRGSLDNQLRCHAVFAALKPRWDLETWRPNVGYAATVAALCNP